MSFLLKSVPSGILLTCSLFAGSVHAADITYSYTGGDFHSYGPNFPIETSLVVRLEFEFTTESVIAPNTNYRLESASTVSYRLTDGYTSMDNSSSSWEPIYGWVETDTQGDIVNWSFSLEHPSPWSEGEARIFRSSRVTQHYTNFEDLAVYDYSVNCGGYCASGASARNYAAEGSWESLTTVPLPAAVWLFGSALLGLGVFKHKRC